MRITGIRFLEVKGTLEHEGPLGMERHVGAMDIYSELGSSHAGYVAPAPAEQGRYPMVAIYMFIDTDAGLSGVWPVRGSARAIDSELKHILIGEDPRAVERIWDKMYRFSVHGRKGETMMALSAVDLALWDIKGKFLGAPAYELLGGPTRDRIQVYASALGCSTDPEHAHAQAKAFVEEGYRATKWFFPCGPADGPEGMVRNLALIRAVREGVGPNVDIMFDAWMGWDVPYTIRMAEQAAEYGPRWFEEPVLADKIDQLVRLRHAISSTAIASGEHEYTRWGAKTLLEARAVDVLQMDVTWAGGLTEMTKVCALASAYDIPVIPHAGRMASTQLIASQTITTCPMQEYFAPYGIAGEFFHKEPLVAEGGYVRLPERPGMGIELDESKIESSRELAWS